MLQLGGKTERKIWAAVLLTGLLGTANLQAASAQKLATWYSSHEYDTAGYRPRVAFNGQTAVEVQQGGASGIVPLLYRVGTIDPSTRSTIAWVSSLQYDNGSAPSVAIAGQTVVEVHQGGASGVVPLWYRVGVLSGSTVVWGSSHQYDRGAHPSVALANLSIKGHLIPILVEVHEGAGVAPVPLWYRLGVVQGSTISFEGGAQKYDMGSAPSVSFDGTHVLEVHNGASTSGRFALWYHSGIYGGMGLQWAGSSHQYDVGANPAVSQMFGQAIEVEESYPSGITPLVYNAGDGPSGIAELMTWYENNRYDNGMAPSVSFYGSAVVGGNFVEVHQGTTGLGPLWYRVGLF